MQENKQSIFLFDRANFLPRSIMLSAPLILGILEIWHPVGVPNKTAFEAILPQIDWWLTLHLLQLPLFGLLALSVILTVRNLQGIAVTICRIGMGFFVVFYLALDAISGIAGGLLIRNARDLSPSLQAFVSQQIDLLFFNPIIGGNTFSFIGILGALGWIVGTIAAAVALFQSGAALFPVILIIIAAISFGISHAPPTGSFGLFCLFIATISIEFFPQENKN